MVVTACVEADKGRAIAQMRPCAAGLYRHQHAATLLQAAGLAVPSALPPYPRPYPDLQHAVDWEEAKKRATAFVPDAAVDALVAVGSGAHIVARTRALMAWILMPSGGVTKRAIRVLRRCWALAHEVLPHLT